MIGIVGYGSWIPFLRVKVEEINKVWGNAALHRVQNCGLTERAVLQPNEDSVTLAVGASKRALEHAGVEKVDAVYFGTCTNPYDTRPSVTLIEEALALTGNVFSCDLQFGGKSGTNALQIGYAMIAAGLATNALCVGSDTINRHSEPGRFNEYAASAGASAFVLGTDDVVAEIKGMTSYSSDLTDFFRLEGERYISDVGAGGKMYPCLEIGFVLHMQKAAEALFEKYGLQAADIDYAVFQQPYGKLPYIIGNRLGFENEKIKPGVVSDEIGDCGSASALLGLANVLDQAKAGQKILLVSYGFGAGADAFYLEATKALEDKRSPYTIRQLLDNKSLIDYAKATRYEFKFAQEPGPLYL